MLPQVERAEAVARSILDPPLIAGRRAGALRDAAPVGTSAFMPGNDTARPWPVAR